MNSILDKYLVNKLISIIFQVAMLELQSINNKLVTRKMLQQMSMLNSALNFEFFQSMWQLNVIPKKKESFHSGSKNCFQYTKEQLQPRNFLRNLSVLLIFLEVFFSTICLVHHEKITIGRLPVEMFGLIPVFST